MISDPFESGISAYGDDLRAGKVSIESTVQFYLERIALHNDTLSAYESVNAENALKSARALDLLLDSCLLYTSPSPRDS